MSEGRFPCHHAHVIEVDCQGIFIPLYPQEKINKTKILSEGVVSLVLCICFSTNVVISRQQEKNIIDFVSFYLLNPVVRQNCFTVTNHVHQDAVSL